MAVLREMPVSELPREKAERYGIASLSARELIALLIRTGSKDMSVLETADEILKETDGVKGLMRITLEDLRRIRGIQKAKALQLLAGIELSRRILREEVHTKGTADNPKALLRWLQSEIGNEMQENFLVIYLDTANQILRYRILFKGTINASGVYPREIFKEAFQCGSTSLILVHNHPAGTLAPSYADKRITERLERAAAVMDLTILDHIIVTSGGYYSFREAGILVQDVEGRWKQ
jgi:DNA repair protein RadC